MALDTQVPAWLQRNWSPRETFDPTPWLQERYKRQVEQQVLPLKLQGMALENQANRLQIEHQGIQNDLQREEMASFARDLPRLRTARMEAAKVPGGSIAIKNPGFESKTAMQLWQEQQKMDAATAYGQAIHQATIDDMKAVTEATQLTGKVLTPGENGQFDPAQKAALLNEANQIKQRQLVQKSKDTLPLVLETDALVNAQKDYELALASGNQVAIDQAKLRFETMQAQASKANETIEMSLDENGRPVTRIIRGKLPAGTSDIEKSTKADLEKKIAASQTSLALIDESLGRIGPSNVGPVGIAREAYETGANIVKPGSTKTPVTAARQTFRMTAQNLYASLKADSQINKLEAQAMKDIVDITKVDIASDTGKQKYQILRDLTALQVVLRSKEAGKPVPDFALKGMSVEQAARSWKRGELSDSDITRWNQLNGVVK